MMTPTGWTLFASCLSVLALVISTFALVAVLRSSARSLSRQLYAHSTMLEDLSHQLRNVRSRLNMAAYRNRKAGTSDAPTDGAGIPDPKTDPAGWKRHMNLQLALGRHHGGKSP